jgi:hypothetical protein
MGGGQAGAPADNDHVPWSRPPGMATVTSLVTARAGQWGRPGSWNRSGPRPGSGLKGQQRGAGAKPPEAAEGLRKSAKE